MDTIKRFAITHLAKSGLRTLAFPNQSRNHYDTKEQAESALEAFRPELQSKLGLVALEVREVECYPNGDAVGIYFESDFHIVDSVPVFRAVCCACQKSFEVGFYLDANGREHFSVYADLTGTPWKAYYCEECSKTARELQAVRRA